MTDSKAKYVRAKAEALLLEWLDAWKTSAAMTPPTVLPCEPMSWLHTRAHAHEVDAAMMRAEAFLLEAATQLEAVVREERKAEEEQARTEGGR